MSIFAAWKAFMIQLDNVWLNSAKELHIKKLNRFTLTSTEETFLKKYRGFLYAKFLKNFHGLLTQITGYFRKKPHTKWG